MENQLKVLIQVVLASILLMSCSSHLNQESYNQTHNGIISGHAYDEYKLQLFKGDKLTVNISTHKLDVVVYSPINVTLKNQSSIDIKSEGEYVLRVLMPRSFARRNEKYEYQLSIVIDRN